MSDQEEMQEVEFDAESFIHIQFASPSSTLFNFVPKNITPGQLIFAGRYLELLGVSEMEKQIAYQDSLKEQKKLAIPKPSILKP